MKKLITAAIALMLLMSLFTGSASAETVTKEIFVGDLNSGVTGKAPFYFGESESNFFLSETIYPSRVLRDLKPGDIITKLTFYTNNGNEGSAWVNYDVFLLETSATALQEKIKTTDPGVTKVTVSNHFYDFTQTSVTVPLDTPYEYKGGNLVVIIKNIWQTPYDDIRFTSAPAEPLTDPDYYHISWSTIGSSAESYMTKHETAGAYLPNITFTVERAAVPETGDSTPIALMMGLALTAGAGFVYLNKRRKSY